MAIIKEELRLTDLIEVSTLQKMQDAFAAMTGVAVCLLYTSDAADER